MLSICAWRFIHISTDIEKTSIIYLSRNATRVANDFYSQTLLIHSFTLYCYALSGGVLSNIGPILKNKMCGG
jgi:hypothetical protein